MSQNLVELAGDVPLETADDLSLDRPSGAQDCSIGPVRLGPGNLPTQHSEFVTQEEHLESLA